MFCEDGVINWKEVRLKLLVKKGLRKNQLFLPMKNQKRRKEGSKERRIHQNESKNIYQKILPSRKIQIKFIIIK